MLNLVMVVMLICSRLWIDMERDEDGSIHASDGAPSLGRLCASVRHSKHTLCQRRAYYMDQSLSNLHAKNMMRGPWQSSLSS